MTDVTDDFNRANGALGSNWVDSPSFTGLTITSNTVGTAIAAWSIAYWNPATNTFANDQHAQVTILGLAGPIVRHQIGSSSGYLAFANIGGGQVLIYRIDSPSTFNLLNTTGGLTINVGDTLSLSITGSNLTALLNGAAAGTAIDATYTSGATGIAANNASLDNFAGGPMIISQSAQSQSFGGGSIFRIVRMVGY